MHHPLSLSRRAFVAGGAAIASVAGLRPGWAQSVSHGAAAKGLGTLSGNAIDLTIGDNAFQVDGRTAHAVTINGSIPAPLLRLREGQNVRLTVANHLNEDTSIHWHGLIVPFQMDGVPAVSFPGIKPHSTFVYEFPVRQSGTYWYHSHSGLQEQLGHYGPMIIDPAGVDPVAYDREHVIMLSDWTFMHPHTLFTRLEQESDVFNRQKLTLTNRTGDRLTAQERDMFNRMRMDPTDIADVTAAAYTYLVNGHSPRENWTGLFQPGERVRLRVINAATQTIFNFRIPGLPMTVVAADGIDVQPVETDEFQIGNAETLDVIVQPSDQAYSIVAETIDRSGMGVATLAPRAGMRAAAPPLRERPVLTMKDMGMDHSTHGGKQTSSASDHSQHSAPAAGGTSQPSMDHAAMDHAAMDHAAMGHAEMDHSTMDHSTMDHAAMGHTAEAEGAAASAPPDHSSMNMRDKSKVDFKVGAGVDMIAPAPMDRIGDPGIGLDDVGHRVLNYRQLVSLRPRTDTRAPSRRIEIHLTGNMERFMWSMDGEKLSENPEPYRFALNERVRLRLINDTMMTHPMHLHGHFVELVNGHGAHQPLKHTVRVLPGGYVDLHLTADAPGDWAFHCHLLYHMHAGMMRIVKVRPLQGEPV